MRLSADNYEEIIGRNKMRQLDFTFEPTLKWQNLTREQAEECVEVLFTGSLRDRLFLAAWLEVRLCEFLDGELAETFGAEQVAGIRSHYRSEPAILKRQKFEEK